MLPVSVILIASGGERGHFLFYMFQCIITQRTFHFHVQNPPFRFMTTSVITQVPDIFGTCQLFMLYFELCIFARSAWKCVFFWTPLPSKLGKFTTSVKKNVFFIRRNLAKYFLAYIHMSKGKKVKFKVWGHLV